MDVEDLLNIAGTIIGWYVDATNAAWTFITAHGWSVTAVGVGIMLVGSAALILTSRRRANTRVPAQSVPAEEDRERTP